MVVDIYFLHGYESSGNGNKGRFFKQHFPQVICPDFHGSLQKRLEKLENICKHQQHLIFIGSSFGGLMATHYSLNHPQKISHLILLAPALNFENYKPPHRKLVIPTTLIIGKRDTITPMETVIPLAKTTFKNLAIHTVDDDHILHNTFQELDWQTFLST